MAMCYNKLLIFFYSQFHGFCDDPMILLLGEFVEIIEHNLEWMSQGCVKHRKWPHHSPHDDEGLDAFDETPVPLLFLVQRLEFVVKISWQSSLPNINEQFEVTPAKSNDTISDDDKKPNYNPKFGTFSLIIECKDDNIGK